MLKWKAPKIHGLYCDLQQYSLKLFCFSEVKRNHRASFKINGVANSHWECRAYCCYHFPHLLCAYKRSISGSMPPLCPLSTPPPSRDLWCNIVGFRVGEIWDAMQYSTRGFRVGKIWEPGFCCYSVRPGVLGQDTSMIPMHFWQKPRNIIRKSSSSFSV